MKKNEAQSWQKETVKKSEMLKRKRRTSVEKEVSETEFCSCKKGVWVSRGPAGRKVWGRSPVSKVIGHPGNQHTGSRPRGASQGRSVNQCSKSCTELISELRKPHTKGQNSRINWISPAQERTIRT